MSTEDLETRITRLIVQAGGDDLISAAGKRAAAALALRFVVQAETWPVFVEFARNSGAPLVEDGGADDLRILFADAAAQIEEEVPDDEMMIGAVSPEDQDAVRAMIAELHATLAQERRSE